MFRALGMHQGPDISLAVAAAALGVPPRSARRALDILLGAFLIQSSRPHRYELHDLLRAYALDQARITDSQEARRDTLDRILRWYIASAAEAARLLSPGDSFPTCSPTEGPAPARLNNAAEALEWFDTERPNLVAGARAGLDVGLPRRAWELAMVLTPIQAHSFAFDDWSALSDLAVTAAETLVDQAALAAALDNRGRFLFRRRLLDQAKAVHTRALAIREAMDDQQGICRSLNALGLVGLRTRELAEAAARFAATAERARRIGDAHWDGLGRITSRKPSWRPTT